MKHRTLVNLAVFLTIFVSAQPLLAQDTESDADAMTLLRERLTGLGEDEISVISRGSTSIDGDWIVLQEDAEINIGGSRSILADVIEYNPRENLVRARGNVVLLENSMRIGADTVELNLTDGTGFLENPFIETEEGYLIKGTRLNKVGPDEYQIESAEITTCNQPRPNWNMAASKIHLKSGEYASLNNFRLRVADAVPIIYLPWMRLPYDRERSTGLLIPEWGTSEFHGRWVSQSFFWAINEQHDATATASFYEERGVRYAGEYRNAMENSTTFARWEFIDDDTFPKDRFFAEIKNRTDLPLNFGLNVNLEFISDNTYKRDFFDRNAFLIPFYRKSAYLTNNTNGFFFQLGYNDIDRFRTRNRISQIRYLPTITLSSRDRQVLGTPLYVNFKTGFDRPSFREIFRRSEFENEDLITEKTYNRFNAEGEVKLPITTFAPWFSITPSAKVNYTSYTHQWNANRSDFIEEGITRNYLDFDVQAVGPILSRVYGDPQNSAYLFKHVITPSFNYLYRSDLDFEDKANLIILDQLDTIYRIHEAKWSIGNTVYMKNNTPDQYGRTPVFELFRFSVSQYISIEDDLLTSFDRRYVFDPNNILATSRYSPLLFDAAVNILGQLSLDGTLEYDIEDNELNNFSLGAGINSSVLNARFSWFRTVGIVRFLGDQTFRSSTNRVISRGSLNLFDGKFRINGILDYDLTREEVITYLAGADLNSQCFGLKVELLKLNQFGQEDTQFRIGITLGGLGGILGGDE